QLGGGGATHVATGQDHEAGQHGVGASQELGLVVTCQKHEVLPFHRSFPTGRRVDHPVPPATVVAWPYRTRRLTPRRSGGATPVCPPASWSPPMPAARRCSGVPWTCP